MPRRASAAASASAGNRCPPVPPAASSTTGAPARPRAIRPRSRRAPAPWSRQHLGARTLARQRQQHSHAIGERDHRRAAIGDERQRHALGRHEVQIDRHVDGGLQAEQDRQAGGGKARERVLVAHRVTQAAHHDEGEQRHQHQAEHDAEFLGRDREDEIGVALGQDALDRPLARAAAEPAAAQEGFQRLVDVEGVAGGGIEEALDAPRHVRNRRHRRRRARRAATPPSPTTQISRMPAMKNSAPQTSAISMVWPKSGCSTSATTASSSRPSAMVLAGISGRRADSPNSQAIRITKAGLRNSDGWMLTPRITIQRRAPLTSAPIEQRQRHQHDARDEHDERDAADLARRQERRHQHHGDRRQQDTGRGG